uniref:Adenylosuccinate synthetase n=1 Tax=candidate division WOR-3 bacterium TaxID=2052148 RepID=A0A7C4UD14_UNCW3
MGTVLIGLQWGDEGKGKVCDYLSSEFDVVVRYQGGPNAGHTVIYDGKEIVLHHIPSGIFRENVICVIGNGCVIDLELLYEEIENLEKLGINIKGRLFISERAHIILPYHKDEDGKMEKSLKIGTTLKGIGPAYMDKYGRSGLRMADLEDQERLKKILKIKTKNEKKMINYLSRYYDEFAHMIIDTVMLLNHFQNSGKKILYEGAQGSMLDIDFGTYPYVTSSSPSIGGVLSGCGVPINSIDRVIGVMKPYTTRVGNGPLPTEIKTKVAKQIRDKGNEYGATTGRERRIGWLDIPQLKYASLINGVNEIFITKLDVLSGLDKINVGLRYLLDGEPLEGFPANLSLFERIEVEYTEFLGWETLEGVDSYFKTPQELKTFVKFIQEQLLIPVKYISIGREREDVLIVN